MYKKIINLSYFFLLVLSVSLFAQTQQIHIDADYAVLHNSESNDTKIVELYYSLYPLEWTYKTDNNGLKTAQVVVELELFQNKKMIYRTAWKSVNTYNEKQAGNEAKIDIMRFKMKKGIYKVFFKVIDVNNKSKKDSISFNFRVPESKTDEYDISDIILCNKARKSKQGDSKIFLRKSLYIEPNASRVFGGKGDQIGFYVEIYGLDKLDDKTAELYYHIDDENGIINKNKYSKREKIINLRKTEGIDGSINIKNLYSGTYYLVFEVLDKDENIVLKKSRKFFLYNPEGNKKEKNDLAVRRSNESVGALKLAGDIDEDTEISSIIYIATKQEKDIIKKLVKSDAKLKFLKEFWAKRDPDLSTVVNEYRKLYLERVAYANANYGTLMDGWRTDMGRVYILYGKPDNIETHNSTARGRAYQVWRYDNIEGGVDFVFISFDTFGNYTLVHSTKRGEIENRNWETMLELNSQNTNGQQINQY